MNKKKIKDFKIEEHIISCDVSYRGGNLKIDVSSIFDTGDEPAIMGAYQNYLGGGIAGAIQSGRQFDISGFSKQDLFNYTYLAECCKKYFFSINNGGGDDYMQENYNTYKLNQKLPKSGY